jgi:hypothetical protein
LQQLERHGNKSKRKQKNPRSYEWGNLAVKNIHFIARSAGSADTAVFIGAAALADTAVFAGDAALPALHQYSIFYGSTSSHFSDILK